MGEQGLEFSRDQRQLVNQLAGFFSGERAPHFSQVKCEQIERRQLGGEGFGRGHPDLRAGVGVDRALGLARDHRADHVADRQGLRALGLGLALGGNGVRRLPRLRDQHGDGIGPEDGIAIAPLAGVVHLDRHARQPLDHELARLGRVPAGAAGGDVQLARRAELGFRDLHLVQKYLPRFL